MLLCIAAGEIGGLDHKIFAIISLLSFTPGCIIFGLIIWLVIASNQKSVNERRNKEQYVEQDATTSSLYNEMHSKIVNSRYRILRTDGQKIWFVWPADDNGYDKTMYVYDSNTNQITEVNLNRTKTYDGFGIDNDDLVIEDIEQQNGIITVIMHHTPDARYGTYYVYQYNCDSGIWTPRANECIDAKFINNRFAVKTCDLDCINPEECNANREYVERYETFQL